MSEPTKEIVVRGCVIRVSAKDAAALEAIEHDLMRNDWNRNEVES